jgi:ribosomal protein S24E
MKSKIIQQNKNPFLHREEIKLEITSPSAPTMEEVKKEIGKDENLIVVKKINANFGRQTFIAEVFVYDSKEEKKAVETIPKKIRLKMAEEEKAAAEKAKAEAEAEAKAAAEPAPVEAPAETPEAPKEEPAPAAEPAPVEAPVESTEEKSEEKSKENKEEAKE